MRTRASDNKGSVAGEVNPRPGFARYVVVILGVCTYSQMEHDEWYRSVNDPSDDWYDPTPRPSGYLVICRDKFSLETAYRRLPRAGYRGGVQPFLFATAQGDQTIVEGVVRPRPYDFVATIPPFVRRRNFILRLPLSKEIDGGADPQFSSNPVLPAMLEDWGRQEIFSHDKQPRLGRIRNVVRPRKEDILGRAMPARILDWVEEWHGLTVSNIAVMLGANAELVRKECQEMVKREWLQVQRGMYYLGRIGILHVARRDRESSKTVEKRINYFITEDHKEVGGHHRHTQLANVTMIKLKKAGIPVFAGWRALQNFPGLTQIRPDLVILAETVLGKGVHYLEVELTAITPKRVSSKLNPWAVANRWESLIELQARMQLLGLEHQESATLYLEDNERVPVIAITETSRAELLFRRLGHGLPLLTTTLRDVRRGPLKGSNTIWRLDGNSIDVQPYNRQQE